MRERWEAFLDWVVIGWLVLVMLWEWTLDRIERCLGWLLG